jgi:hypothetical protein
MSILRTFVQRSVECDLSPAGERHLAVSRFSKTKKKSRAGRFFGFAFFTADFLALFFALLFPLPMSALAAW